MNKNNFYKLLRYATLFGDAIYIFWLLYNGIDEGFRGINTVQGIAVIGIILLLTLNIVLLSHKR
jgi:hypothetical protein